MKESLLIKFSVSSLIAYDKDDIMEIIQPQLLKYLEGKIDSKDMFSSLSKILYLIHSNLQIYPIDEDENILDTVDEVKEFGIYISLNDTKYSMIQNLTLH